MPVTPNFYDLDDVAEYFEFKIEGHTYRFKYLNTQEYGEFKLVANKLSSGDLDAEKNLGDFLRRFITPAVENSPSFDEIEGKIISSKWNRFYDMVLAEMAGKPHANSQS